jgi:glucoamylase
MSGRLSARVACLGGGTMAAALAAGALALAPAAHSAGTSVAPGAPGSESYFDLARKDCVGTAFGTRSKVWFTVADGALSDVYWPTVDATNVHSLEYLVSDGSTFTDVQGRDMRYESSADPTGMSCTVTASDPARGYRITTTYLADPSADAVLMRITFAGPAGDHLYVRLDPLAGGTGGGGSQNAGPNTAELVSAGARSVPVASNPSTVTDAVNRTYGVPTFEALQSSGGFGEESVGYAGTASDGQTMLDSAHRLTRYDRAPDGHVALTAELALGRSHTTVLALGLAQTAAAAIRVAGTAARAPFARLLARYEAGWQRYDARLNRPSPRLGSAVARQYYRSVNVVRASMDKTFPGAIAAGLASPWGQAVPAGNTTNGQPTYFGSYREVFARDLYEAFTALLLAGDRASARAATRFLFERQQLPSGAMPRNSLENGLAAPDTGGLQLDETSYPILMDWESGLAGDRRLYRDHVVPAADFLVANGPSDGVERWEEQTGYSPSTIAAEIAGLTAAAGIARANGDGVRAALYQATADDFARNIKAWTVTTNGPYAPSYFIRLSKTGDPNAAITYYLGNGSITVDQREVIDAGFLELVRLGILPASDPTVQASLKVVDATIERQTPSGPGFYRYGTRRPGSEDGYGDCWEPDPTSCHPSGAPWPTTDSGSGHLWPVLAGERGEFEVAAGRSGQASTLLTAMRAMTSGGYLEPEQAWEDPPLPASPFGSDPTTASIGFAPGHPAGSASPLTWAQAQFARLTLDLGTGRDLDTPQVVAERYARQGMPGTLPLTVTSPANGATVSGSTVTVTGTSTPGAVVVAQGEPPFGGNAPVAHTVTGSNGQWSLQLPAAFGTTTITVTATLARSTGYSLLTVSDLTLPGTVVLQAADPTGDDNGPGTYAYPTASAFQPGAFDLTGIKVSQDATSVYIQVGIRNLAPTFGAQFGAQLLDVYVRNPSVTPTSTAPAYSILNYTIAPPDAWTERVEAQGFAPVAWVNTAGTSLGSGYLVVDQAGGTATVVLPRAGFGTVGPHWVFTVALTGQGSGQPPVRGFTPTPGQYTFGVCPTPTTASPICAVSPSAVPNVMDTIPPPGVAQSTELDPTRGPVSLQGLTVP